MKFFRNPALIIVSIVSVLAYNLAYADPGETDEKGGHYNRQTGEYHYHNAPAAPNESALATLAMIEAQALADAKRDAQFDNVWFGYGLCCGVFAIGSAYIAKAQPPVENLLGKSPEYVNFYTKAYKEEMREERAKAAAIGCAISSGIWLILNAVLQDN